MAEIVFSHPQNNLYLVTDSHLDLDEAPYQEFVAMLAQLEDPQVVICLGDLFKVWLALPKFWGTINREVMQAFEQLRARKVEIIFVIGNREVLLPRKWNDSWKQQFPFTYLVHDDCALIWGEQRYGLIHGDTINRQDLNYLRWRKIARSRGFEAFFRLKRPLPNPIKHLKSLFLQKKLKRLPNLSCTRSTGILSGIFTRIEKSNYRGSEEN